MIHDTTATTMALTELAEKGADIDVLRLVRPMVYASEGPMQRNAYAVSHPLGGESQRRTLRSVQEIIDVLAHEFLLRLPQHLEPKSRLAGMIR